MAAGRGLPDSIARPRTARHVDILLVVLEPYYKALETARRAADLARELGVAKVLGVSNKARSAEDAAAVRDYARAHDLPLAAEIPQDEEVRRADADGRSPMDMPAAAAIRAIEDLATALLSSLPEPGLRSGSAPR